MSRHIVALALATTVLLALVACNSRSESTEQQEQTARMTVREYAQWCGDTDPIKISDSERYSDLTAASQARYLTYRDLLFSGRVPFTLVRYHLFHQEVAESLYRFSFRQNQNELVDSLQLTLTVFGADNPGDLLERMETGSSELDDVLERMSPEDRAILEGEGCPGVRR